MDITTRCGAFVFAIASLTCCERPRRPEPTQQPAKQARNFDGELTSLRLSRECQDAAASFWHRQGYDRPDPPAKGTSENWGYQSHYNSEQKRCFILVDLTTILPSGGTSNHQEIFDAIEGGYPLATQHRQRDASVLEEHVTLMRGNTGIDVNAANLAWFEGFMTK